MDYAYNLLVEVMVGDFNFNAPMQFFLFNFYKHHYDSVLINYFFDNDKLKYIFFLH